MFGLEEVEGLAGGEQETVRLRAARSGRPRRSRAAFRPGEMVRVEVRLPAIVAAALYDRAQESDRSVSAVAAELLKDALSDESGAPLE